MVGKDHKIVAVMSSTDDKITPDQHVDKSLAMVKKMKIAKIDPAPAFFAARQSPLARTIVRYGLRPRGGSMAGKFEKRSVRMPGRLLRLTKCVNGSGKFLRLVKDRNGNAFPSPDASRS